MTCPAKALANKIEIHLKLDDTPGYYLSKEDQQMIIDCLNFTSKYKIEKNYQQGVLDATDLIDALWSDLFNKDLIKADGANCFDKWRKKIKDLK